MNVDCLQLSGHCIIVLSLDRIDYPHIPLFILAKNSYGNIITALSKIDFL